MAKLAHTHAHFTVVRLPGEVQTIIDFAQKIQLCKKVLVVQWLECDLNNVQDLRSRPGDAVRIILLPFLPFHSLFDHFLGPMAPSGRVFQLSKPGNRNFKFTAERQVLAHFALIKTSPKLNSDPISGVKHRISLTQSKVTNILAIFSKETKSQPISYPQSHFIQKRSRTNCCRFEKLLSRARN